MKPSGIGGQAVIEGVMMKNKDQYAIAVRKPDKEIEVKKDTFNSVGEKHKLWKLPILRGILAFAESMIIGIKTLNFSASFYEEEEAAKESKVDKAVSKVFGGKAESVIMAFTMIIAVVLAVGIFIVLPAFAAGLLGKTITSDSLVAFVEGVIRIVLFVLYVFAISQLRDIKRVFMYHGAEHKTINCIENGFDLTVENVKWQSRQHKRCGTSFLFIVMFVSVIFFMFIRTDLTWLRYASRILLVPVIAGVSYEFIRFAGKNDSVLVRILSKPGMWLQGLTTKEPDDDMIEVAIQSVEAVFDWRAFLNKEESGEKAEQPAKAEKETAGAAKKGNSTGGGKTAVNHKPASNHKPTNNNKTGKGSQKTGSGKAPADSKRTAGSQHAGNAKGGTGSSTNSKTGRNNGNRYNNSKSTAEKPLRDISDNTALFEEDDEILRALDDFVAVTDETTDKE